MLGAIFGGFSKVLGGIAAGKAAQARNRAAIERYERAKEQRKRAHFQKLSIYSAKINKYKTDLTENDLAANRGYAQAQAALGAAQSKALAESEGLFIKYVQEKLGKTAASGATGRSAARIDMMDFAAFKRKQADFAFKLTRSREAYDSNVEAIRNQQKSARNKLYGNVMWQPVADLPPIAPQMENTSLPVLQGILGAAAGFANAGETDTGVDNFDDSPQIFGGVGDRGGSGFGTNIYGRDFDDPNY